MISTRVVSFSSRKQFCLGAHTGPAGTPHTRTHPPSVYTKLWKGGQATGNDHADVSYERTYENISFIEELQLLKRHIISRHRRLPVRAPRAIASPAQRTDRHTHRLSPWTHKGRDVDMTDRLMVDVPRDGAAQGLD
eukprot:6206344-Pleurochrysis_carterae.AAC.4